MDLVIAEGGPARREWLPRPCFNSRQAGAGGGEHTSERDEGLADPRRALGAGHAIDVQEHGVKLKRGWHLPPSLPPDVSFALTEQAGLRVVKLQHTDGCTMLLLHRTQTRLQPPGAGQLQMLTDRLLNLTSDLRQKSTCLLLAVRTSSKTRLFEACRGVSEPRRCVGPAGAEPSRVRGFPADLARDWARKQALRSCISAAL